VRKYEIQATALGLQVGDTLESDDEFYADIAKSGILKEVTDGTSEGGVQEVGGAEGDGEGGAGEGGGESAPEGEGAVRESHRGRKSHGQDQPT